MNFLDRLDKDDLLILECSVVLIYIRRKKDSPGALSSCYM